MKIPMNLVLGILVVTNICAQVPGSRVRITLAKDKPQIARLLSISKDSLYFEPEKKQEVVGTRRDLVSRFEISRGRTWTLLPAALGILGIMMGGAVAVQLSGMRVRILAAREWWLTRRVRR